MADPDDPSWWGDTLQATTLARTPRAFTAGLPPHWAGLPPAVVWQLLTQPTYGEGVRNAPGWPSPYAGEGREGMAGFLQSQDAQMPSRDALMLKMLRDKELNQSQNFPTWEQNTPGMDDNLGFTRLPSGQYLPSNNPHLLGYFMGQQNDRQKSHMDMMSLLMQMMPQGSGGP